MRMDRLRAAVASLDAGVGIQVERAVAAHHRRRLARLGHRLAYAPPAGGWAAGGPPQRGGNRLEVLVDGAEALDRIAAALDAARESVWLAGWFFTPEFQLRRDEPRTLRDRLRAAAERADVRLLAWAGSPVPLFRPDRRDAARAAGELRCDGRVRVALDARERPLHCHHEKLVVVDGETAFVGGIDLTSYSGDRLDTSEHPARGSRGWHDVATVLHGPAVADVAAHFRMRWRGVTGEALPAPPAPPPAGATDVQVVRTVPERLYPGLRGGEFTILESYLRALRSARRLIYLENQFLWSPEVVAVLAQKLREPPDPDFRLVVVLPAKPNTGNDDTRGQLGVLAEADARAHRFLACTLYQEGAGGEPVYVHAKVGIVDDEWLTVGSANLNEHSLFNDTEVNVVTHDPELARATRLRLWSEHLGRPEAEVDVDPTRVVDEVWRPVSQEQLDRRERGLPLTDRLVRLPHVSRRAGAVRGPLSGLLVDG
jgi:phosphatidylserine/phosphatidylglycerophosphate/cardiolipin synthase-like enzyme